MYLFLAILLFWSIFLLYLFMLLLFFSFFFLYFFYFLSIIDITILLKRNFIALFTLQKLQDTDIFYLYIILGRSIFNYNLKPWHHHSSNGRRLAVYMKVWGSFLKTYLDKALSYIHYCIEIEILSVVR